MKLTEIADGIVYISLPLVCYAMIGVSIYDRLNCVYCSETYLFMQRWHVYGMGSATILLNILYLRVFKK